MSDFPPIPAGQKGRLRWDEAAGLWTWVAFSPYFKVLILRNGSWRCFRNLLSRDCTEAAMWHVRALWRRSA